LKTALGPYRWHAVAARATCVAVWLSLAQAAWAQAQPAKPDEPVHVITTSKGDTVIGLSKRYLSDPKRWPEVVAANALPNANRIATGASVRIPLRLMRVDAVPAKIVSVTGAAQSAASPGAGNAQAPLQAGQEVPEGGEVITGPDGHVTIRLVDGTLLRLRPDSRLHLRESNRLRDVDSVRSGARLRQGRVEVEAAPAPAGRPGFNIDTPQGVLGVRGTEFRVSVDGSGTDTKGEVLGGAVAFSGLSGPGGERVGAGFGTLIAANGQVAPPVRLLPKPEVANLPSLQERLVMRFALPPVSGAQGYHAQIGRDAGFDQVVADQKSASPELRFADLPDGDYVLRVRAVDTKGLEGLDADHRFRLKARPEPPLPALPAPRAAITGTQVELAWAANKEAQSYRLRLARNADFKTVLRDVPGLKSLSSVQAGLASGIYFWQLASVRVGADQKEDQGPWGDVRSFELRSVPPEPQPPKVGTNAVTFSWLGTPGQTFDFEVARDAGFAQMVLQRALTVPSFELLLPLPAPSSGRFFVRVRAKDPDGFVGPFGVPQFFEIAKPAVINCWLSGSDVCVRTGDETLNRSQ
jgi:hypothetical protein